MDAPGAGCATWSPPPARCVDARGPHRSARSASGVDVTERREAEERLRASEERYRSVVESVGDIVFQTDLRGRWTFLNETLDALDRASRSRRRSDARPCEVVHPADRAAHARAFAPLIAGEVDVVRLRHRYVTAEGVTRWAEVRARLARDAAGRPLGVAGVIEDVTERHRTQQYEAAEQAVVDVLDARRGPRERRRRRCSSASASTSTGTSPSCGRSTPSAEVLICTDAAGERRDGLEALEAARDGRDASRSATGCPGQAWARRTPIWASGAARRPAVPPRRAAAFAAGVSSALAMPIARGGEVLAAILFFSREQREPDPGLNRLLRAVGAHLAQFLERRRVERALGERTTQLSELSRLTWAVLGR